LQIKNLGSGTAPKHGAGTFVLSDSNGYLDCKTKSTKNPLIMKKTLLCILLSAPLVTFAQQSGTISGVITYFFNDNFGDRPDVGAKVYVFKEKVVPPGVFEYSTLDTFRVVNNYRELESLDKEMSEQEKESIKKYGHRN
jgi:hypothetical protein